MLVVLVPIDLNALFSLAPSRLRISDVVVADCPRRLLLTISDCRRAPFIAHRAIVMPMRYLSFHVLQSYIEAWSLITGRRAF